jgi:putative DNA-invertase from lambdoid prophage Rac
MAWAGSNQQGQRGRRLCLTVPHVRNSRIKWARVHGVVSGRRVGPRIKADRFAPKLLKLVSEGQSYRDISHRLGLSKNTVLEIVKRDRAA